ncbi:MAG: flagellar basal body P-ring formation chaperone FlgA [Rhodocyclaceae bacterium]|nr:flagellar basal body P-ring formation chaperone FlgA [Rhodocyclaceae bacterium]
MRLVFLLFALLGQAAWAQQDPLPVKKAVLEWLKVQTRGLPGEVSIEVGSLDPGNRLAPCHDFEVSRPAGAKPWGRTNVLVRCLDEAGWRVYVPVQIRIKAAYLVSARPIAQGQELTATDLATQVGDLAELPASILTDASLAIGKVAASPIPAGRPLRADLLKMPTVVRSGQTVKLVSRGPGFAVTNEGRALNQAAEGQPVQVRLTNGQVVSGIARAGGIVEVSY